MKTCLDLKIKPLFVTYQRLELSTMTPLSTENMSVGKPAIFQALIFIGSPRVLLKEKFSEQRIFFSWEKKEKKRKPHLSLLHVSLLLLLNATSIQSDYVHFLLRV